MACDGDTFVRAMNAAVALVAGFLLPDALQFSGIAGQIISAAIGAIILLFIVSLFSRLSSRKAA